MEKKVIRLEDCIPAALVDEGFILARDGSVTIGWELTPPQEYIVQQEAYDSMVTLMASAFRGLPEWTMVHRQDIYSRKKYHSDMEGSFLDGCYSKHFEGRSYLEHRQFLFFTISPGHPGRVGAMKSTLQGAASGIRYRVQGQTDMERDLLHFENRAREFISVFAEGSGMESRRLTSEDLEGRGCRRGLLDDYVNWFADGDQVADITQEDGTFLVRDGKRMFSYSFSRTDDLPGEVDNTVIVKSLSSGDDRVLLSAGSPVGSQLDCEHIVNSYFLYPDQQEALRDLDRKRKRMTSMSSGSAENTVNAEGVANFINMIHSDSTAAIYTHMNVFVWGDARDEMALRGAAGAALSRMGLLSKMNTLDMPQLWIAAMPGGEMEIGEDNFMIAELEQALCLGINESFIRDIPGGALRICDRHRHVPVITDTQEAAYKAKLIENYNAFILGPSGSGKSFFTNWYVRNCYDRGQHVFIIDKGGSYEVLCALINEESGGRDGIYHTWSTEHPYSFNPFDGWKGWAQDEEGSGLNFLLDLLKVIWTPDRGWGDSNNPILAKTVEDFIAGWKRKEDPMFADYIDYIGTEVGPRIDPSILKSRSGEKKRKMEPYMVGYSPVTAESFNVKDFLQALSPFAKDGRFSFLLNNPSPPDLFTSRFAVFEMDAVENQSKEVYKICTLCIMNAFEKKMRSIRGFKLMVIEEAWKAIATDSMVDFLRNLWKVARKFHTSATVVTQQISDILASAVIKDAILGNSPVKILLDQRNNAGVFDEMARLMGLSPVDRALVRSVGRDIDRRYNYKEAFITLGGNRSAVYALEVSPEEAWAYESDKDEKAPLLERARELGSMKAALKEYALIPKNTKKT